MVRLRDVRRKVPVTVRLDQQALEWLRGKGEGHLTRINDILVNLMEAERKAAGNRQNLDQNIQYIESALHETARYSTFVSGGLMGKKEIYIERRPQGDYAVRRPGSDRASAVEPTQADAINRAGQIAPNASVLVERVRNTSV